MPQIHPITGCKTDAEVKRLKKIQVKGGQRNGIIIPSFQKADNKISLTFSPILVEPHLDPGKNNLPER